MATQLLDDDGRASMATAFMTSHHGFRRDVAWLARGLAAASDAVLAEAWKDLHEHLLGHHTVEDTSIFPSMAAEHPALAATLTTLATDHHALDALLTRGDALFGVAASAGDDRPDRGQAIDRAGCAALVAELRALLLPHLELEERDLIPHLRDAFAFPGPDSDEGAAMYADGFAWSTFGVAPQVLEALRALLPANVAARFDDARARFRAQSERRWGPIREGATTTSDPDV